MQLLLWPLLLCYRFASAVQTIDVKGASFVNSAVTTRFSVIGVDYQPGGSSGFSSSADPLSDPTSCLRDAILMQQLGINTIRVYNLDPNLDHNECASIFNAAGIYMLLDVNSGLSGTFLDRSDPSSTYTLGYLQHIFGVVEAFSRFPNTLGFLAGNEIINQDSVSSAPGYIRAVVRDMKEYIAKNIPRTVGVGYSAADVPSLLLDSWNYLACNLDNATSSNIDFFGLNDYEWCGDSSFTQSGYNDLVAMFAGTWTPIFFSEYGCNNVEPRTFTNVPVLYGPEMQTFSGGLVYEWTQEANNYGLIDLNSSSEVTLLDDYSYLKHEYNSLDVKLLQSTNSTAQSIKPSSCVASMITGSFVNNWNIPDRPSGGDDLVTSGLSSANTGSLIPVTATTIGQSVVNYTGQIVSGLALKILDESDDNYPGLVSTYTATGYTGTVAITGKPSATQTHHHSKGSRQLPSLCLLLACIVLL